ncbi:MAG: rRNA maturation RNase YbeY [Deltaproteobacteria bacterium]|nr:rRNA maturation RNase YbeY [Deltaproteobacteria bacterium]MBW1993274.1 rRNA maturation RNase YbeY [Deltaproteobacteria bacterium]MBW2152867.1 rRNA maturation RNase YbeY [Deltaproteobacteria bacterium]
MAVQIDNRQNNIRISLKRTKKTAQAILDALDFHDGELSIVIVDDKQIEELNRAYFQRKGPTNVIAFPMREGPFSDLNPQLLGDVVISAETAKKEGEAAGISTEERFNQLLVHGILHLFGFDHEKDKRKEQEMEKKTAQLMAMLKRSG